MPTAWGLKAKPGTPSHYSARGRGLWRQCIFAASSGSIRGFRSGFLATGGDIDFVQGHHARAEIFTAGGFTPNNVNFQTWSCGLGWDNGDGATSANPEGWAGTASDNRYNVSQAGFTAAVIIRPDAFSTNGQLPFFKRGPQPYGAAQAGWRFTGAAGNLWRFNYSDGVTQRTVTGGAQDPNFTRPDLLVVRLNIANTQLDWFVNGIQVAVVAFAATPMGNPAVTEDIKIDGYDTTTGTYPGWVPLGLVWERPLSNQEIATLYSDPFIMFRNVPSDELLGNIARPPQPSFALDTARLTGPDPAFSDFAGAGGASECCCCVPAMSLMF